MEEQIVEAQFLMLQHLTLARVEEGDSANLLARSRLSFNVAGWFNWLGNTQHGSVVHRVAIQASFRNPSTPSLPPFLPGV